MGEFLTWNGATVEQLSFGLREWFIVSALEVSLVSLLAYLVTQFLDKFGAPDDDLIFDPLYDEW